MWSLPYKILNYFLFLCIIINTLLNYSTCDNMINVEIIKWITICLHIYIPIYLLLLLRLWNLIYVLKICTEFRYLLPVIPGSAFLGPVLSLAIFTVYWRMQWHNLITFLLPSDSPRINGLATTIFSNIPVSQHSFS